jgi:transposase
MPDLADVDPADLRAALDRVETATAATRLVVALAYLDGVPVDTVVERYGVPRSTAYAWLERFEERPPLAAATDDERTGRPPALDADQRATLDSALEAPPADAGVDAPEWTPAAVRTYVEREFGVEYSLGHVRRLLRERGD